MIVAGAAGGMAWAAIPAWLRTRFNANEILTSLMLVYVATLALSLPRARTVARSGGLQLPAVEAVRRQRAAARSCCRARGSTSAFCSRSRSSPRAGCSCAKRSPASRCASPGSRRAAANYAGISATRTVWLGMLVGGATRGHRRRRRSRGADRPAAAVDFAGLRLRRDHRRLRRPAASAGHRCSRAC